MTNRDPPRPHQGTPSRGLADAIDQAAAQLATLYLALPEGAARLHAFAALESSAIWATAALSPPVLLPANAAANDGRSGEPE